jgi:hypothetical protein
MYRISGPIIVYAIKKDDKNILLFGDQHGNREGVCKKCVSTFKCSYITEFFKQLKTSTDVFIESPWLSNNDKKKMKPTLPFDVISNVVNNEFINMYEHTRKEHNIRTHYTDIRTDMNLKTLVDIMMTMYDLFIGNKENKKEHSVNIDFFNHFKTTKNIKEFIDLLILSDDYRTSLEKCINEPLFRKILHVESLTASPEVQKKKIHRVRKQILKLTQEYKKALLRFHNDRCKELMQETNDFNITTKKIKIQTTISREDALIVFHTLLLWLSHVKDIYTLARILYYLDKTNTIISYDGGMHSMIYKRFFTDYIKGTKLLYEVNKLNAKRVSRCVTLPYQYIKTIIDC